MKKSLCIISLIFMFLTNGMSITSVRDNEKNFYEYKKILIISNSVDLEFKKNTEYGLSKKFSDAGIEAVPGMELFSPLKEHSAEEIIKKAKSENFDCILTVGEGQFTGRSYSFASVWGYYNSWSNSSNSYGYSANSAEKIIEIFLTEVKTDEPVFKATTKTGEIDVNREIFNEIMNNVATDRIKNFIKSVTDKPVVLKTEKKKVIGIYGKQIFEFELREADKIYFTTSIKIKDPKSKLLYDTNANKFQGWFLFSRKEDMDYLEEVIGKIIDKVTQS
ncbi:MAG: hypothetical protein K6E69_08570 [Treponema sp.]|uniref:hypothetical protein n=1 Tax=Treponema sp. TaxID=166 RepID=UPI00298E7984|nr:hypothetical protein [Treponema sp.]MCR5387161.1 hypothetical protein [Treponema sp.]